MKRSLAGVDAVAEEISASVEVVNLEQTQSGCALDAARAIVGSPPKVVIPVSATGIEQPVRNLAPFQ